MIPIDQMLSRRGRWFDGSGPSADEILSTRIRLARNVRDIRFVGRAREDELSGVLARVGALLEDIEAMRGGGVARIRDLDLIDRQFLLERHLLSHDMTAEAKQGGIAVAPDESLSLMINEEDHLRLQSLHSGLQLFEAWTAASALDDEIGKEIGYAFSEEFGFLTSCPTNVGTGMRASVLVHLPALVLTQRIKKVLGGVTQVGFAVRGFHGEGTDVVGNFFQVSNQITLGVSEGQTLEKLRGVVQQILDMEAKSRDALMRDAPLQIEDKVGRSLATLKYARLLTSQECVGLLSAVRFGITLGLPHLPELSTINELLLYSQPAHLQKLGGRAMASGERNEYRASWIQQRLNVSDAPHLI